ncbi:allophanate hydrolase subunit 1 [Yimella sp. cx-51]|uniref:5-oxoprolinase subunit B family protein n=1 Tax=Yimella sp. cx-51 TaxID=2770551 RepID=UPI00165DF2B5|nr:allophanate hydrolase subunit 1 [Yimella sp. cx-51]MBC9957726.1 allophanate hydrolase subunit 1 [Yimella sp. cx-51]QTH36924.1 allophanate hydrolase subunit 1 [Yimella sp. cx-51]
MRLLPCGSYAILVDLPDEAARRRFDRALRAARSTGFLADDVVEQVPAARTVLVRVRPGVEPASVARELRALASDDPVAELVADGELSELVVFTVYDGPDLDSLAQILGTSTDELVEWHTGSTWTVDFAGFAPGFGYLVRDEASEPPFDVSIPRLARPRTRLPAGSVGLAGSYSGIYPSASAGGWQLIGRTELRTWDAGRDEPARLIPGRRVRFEVAQ